MFMTIDFRDLDNAFTFNNPSTATDMDGTPHTDL